MMVSQMHGIDYDKSRINALIDEAPGAYKDIDTVMNDANSLVSIKHELHQLINIKG